MGIRDKPIAPGSPRQNSLAERLIGSIRRECVDHVIALGEQHLRRVLKSYAIYYNSARTHRSLDKDSPVSRPVQRVGRIVMTWSAAFITSTSESNFSVRTGNSVRTGDRPADEELLGLVAVGLVEKGCNGRQKRLT